MGSPSSTRTQAPLPARSERDGLVQRLYQGFGRSYHYDRYIDCSSMVHLRWCQGCPSSPTSTTTTNARVTSFEVGGTKQAINPENIKSRLTNLDPPLFPYFVCYHMFALLSGHLTTPLSLNPKLIIYLDFYVLKLTP